MLTDQLNQCVMLDQTPLLIYRECHVESLQLRKFEKDVQLFVEQVKKESKQRERLASRIEDLGDLSWRVENLSSAFRQSSGEFERAVSLIRAEADQKRNAGNQVGRV